MTDKSFDWRNTGQKISMGERVGKLVPFLKDTACVHVNERELIGNVRAFQVLLDDTDPESKEFKDWLTQKAIPALTYIGLGKWYRDTITDLALALSKKKVRQESEDLSGLYEELGLIEGATT
jgi:hypothetical protein